MLRSFSSVALQTHQNNQNPEYIEKIMYQDSHKLKSPYMAARDIKENAHLWRKVNRSQEKYCQLCSISLCQKMVDPLVCKILIQHLRMVWVKVLAREEILYPHTLNQSSCLSLKF